MIRSITGSRYITVERGMPGPTYMNPPMSALNVGQVRFNSTLQGMEVYDGTTWLQIHSNHSSIDLNQEATAALDWVRHKMHQEKQLQELMDKHPGLKDLHDKFEMLRVLCEQEEKEKDGS